MRADAAATERGLVHAAGDASASKFSGLSRLSRVSSSLELTSGIEPGGVHVGANRKGALGGTAAGFTPSTILAAVTAVVTLVSSTSDLP